jgi:hypothetical protein
MRTRDVERDGRQRVESNPPPPLTYPATPASPVRRIQGNSSYTHRGTHRERERERERESTSCQLFGSKKKTAINFIIIVIIIII